jgi:RNA polymerase sigma factor (sigma-70 family)
MIDTAALYKKHGAMVFRRAVYVLGDKQLAQDVVQEVFMKLHNARHTLNADTGLSSWLYTAATHICFNAMRDTKNRTRILDDHAHTHSTHSDMIDLPALRQAMANSQMDVQLWSVAVYRFVDEMTHQEIADQIGCSRRHVGDLLTTIDAQLQKLRSTG